MPVKTSPRWVLDEGFGIHWDAAADSRKPHTDAIEMSGRRVSLIVRYGVDAAGRLLLSRRVIWPQLRTIPNNTHASLRRGYELAETQPLVCVNGQPLGPEQPEQITLDGLLTIRSSTPQGLEVARCIFPSRLYPAVLERWTLTNCSGQPLFVEITPPQQVDYARGTKGVYVLEVDSAARSSVELAPGEGYSFGISISGRRLAEPSLALDVDAEEAARRGYVEGLMHALRLECPDPLLVRAFDFAKLRAAESIFETAGGLMHGPGGDAYYAAVWCNDQCEYANPFFPFLGDEAGNQSALNCYRLYVPFMGPNYSPIPSSIVAEGTDIWEGAGDRGDAAMYAYGASRYALALGDRGVAEELWPAIEWCLEYCRRHTTPEGVVASDSDELEGRFSHGKTNLATSSLTYGALRSAADLAMALNRADASEIYAHRAERLAQAIEAFFGVEILSYHTYRYHEGLRRLRSWICLPLVMGLMDRKAGTTAALFSRSLWTADGLRTETGGRTYWDRSTLYAFRGVFFAGETDQALERFQAYTRRRLVGEHVPYPVEAYPEGNQRQLSAESALYGRVVTEGLFGITPAGFDAFRCKPGLPSSWEHMALRSVKAFGREFDLVVERKGDFLHLSVWAYGREVFAAGIPQGGEVTVRLP